MQKLFLCCMFVLLGGCSVHKPFIIKNTTDLTSVGSNKYPSHTERIFISKGELPPEVKYEVLEQIEIGKVWYGSKGNIQESMANRARQIGADAIVNFNSWYQPSGWSWAAPHGSGKAVKIQNKSSVDFSTLNGECR